MRTGPETNIDRLSAGTDAGVSRLEYNLKLAFTISASAAGLFIVVMLTLLYVGLNLPPRRITDPSRNSTPPSITTCAAITTTPSATVVDLAEQSTCNHMIPSLEEGPSDGNSSVDGATANASRYPWFVSVYWEQEQSYSFCGGSIIDDQHILTSAACLTNLANLSSSVGLVVDTDQSLFRIGVGNVERNSVPLHEVKVKAAFVHKGFSLSEEYYNHNIAVLRLNGSLSVLAGWNTLFKPVCLPAPTEIKGENTLRCKVIGWGEGNLTDSPPSSENVQSVDLEIHGFAWCFMEFGFRRIMLFFQDDDLVCSKRDPVRTGPDYCFKNLGGPLVCRNDSGSVLEQIGVTSFTFQQAPCGSPRDHATAYVDVTVYRPWLQYVAMPVLANVDEAQAWLQCQRQKCFDLVEQRYGAKRVLERNKQYICASFAAYDFCRLHDPKPQRCSIAVPMFVNRPGSIPAKYWRRELQAIYDAYRNA